MNAVSLSCAGLAVLLLVAALLLWGSANASKRRRATTVFVESQLERLGARPDSAREDDLPLRGRRSLLPGLANLLLRAGVESERRFLVLLAVCWLGLSCAALLYLGMLPAAITFLLVGALAWCRLWWLAERRTQKIVRQLPAFLDALVRMVTIGSSLPSAFQDAVPQSDPPLRAVLARVVQLTLAGLELDVAMRQVARQYRIEELFLIAAVIDVSTRFGGRVDQVLDRMSAFMRDIQQAHEELVALSAETRLSAWILALLPIGLGGFIMIFNNAMFTNMWRDPVGKELLLGAFGLQVAGSFWLYRLAKAV